MSNLRIHLTVLKLRFLKKSISLGRYLGIIKHEKFNFFCDLDLAEVLPFSLIVMMCSSCANRQQSIKLHLLGQSLVISSFVNCLCVF